MARPVMNWSPISSMPISDTTTVEPAKMTARPAVSIASSIACAGAEPRCTPSRYRVTMNKA
jgi:hypothetical protein